MKLHVENSQVKLQHTSFCGKPIKGQHIFGVNNLMYYEGDGRVCKACILAIVRKLKHLRDKV